VVYRVKEDRRFGGVMNLVVGRAGAKIVMVKPPGDDVKL
jgi:hypothetical protein